MASLLPSGPIHQPATPSEHALQFVADRTMRELQQSAGQLRWPVWARRLRGLMAAEIAATGLAFRHQDRSRHVAAVLSKKSVEPFTLMAMWMREPRTADQERRCKRLGRAFGSLVSLVDDWCDLWDDFKCGLWNTWLLRCADVSTARLLRQSPQWAGAQISQRIRDTSIVRSTVRTAVSRLRGCFGGRLTHQEKAGLEIMAFLLARWDAVRVRGRGGEHPNRFTYP